MVGDLLSTRFAVTVLSESREETEKNYLRLFNKRIESAKQVETAWPRIGSVFGV